MQRRPFFECRLQKGRKEEGLRVLTPARSLW